MSAVKVKLKVPANGCGCEIEIDGKPVTNAKALRFTVLPNQAPVLSIDYVNIDVEIEGEAEIVDVTGLSDKIRRFEKR